MNLSEGNFPYIFGAVMFVFGIVGFILKCKWDDQSEKINYQTYAYYDIRNKLFRLTSRGEDIISKIKSQYISSKLSNNTIYTFAYQQILENKVLECEKVIKKITFTIRTRWNIEDFELDDETLNFLVETRRFYYKYKDFLDNIERQLQSIETEIQYQQSIEHHIDMKKEPLTNEELKIFKEHFL